MIRTILIAIGLVMATQTASAAKISPRDRTGVELSKAWMTEDIKPRRSADGSVVFQYGATLPTVVCAPLRVCDIALQPGEKVISSPKLGDTVRWKLAPAKSGPEGAEIIHAVVKPTEPGLDTTLMIPTDRRMYHLRLVSTKTDWMPFISFEYPEDHEKAWAEIQVAQAEQQRRESMRKLEVGASRMPVEDLNFEYEIDGESHWRPVRVFDDGSHTYIDLPHKAKHRDAPILLVNDAEQDRLVNYRMHGSRFIVDTLFDQAKLISGVGDNQQKVVIPEGRAMSRVIIGILIAALLGGCQNQMIRDDLAPVKAGAAGSIVADWAQLLQDRYPATTVFEIKGMGKIGTALAKELRSLGYGVADTQDQPTTESVPIEVRSDKLGSKGILVSLIIKDQIISRSYTVSESEAAADSAFSELAAGRETVKSTEETPEGIALSGTPTGIRRLNKIPLLIIGAAGILIVTVVAYALHQRSQPVTLESVQEDTRREADETSVRALTEGHHGAYIEETTAEIAPQRQRPAKTPKPNSPANPAQTAATAPYAPRPVAAPIRRSAVEDAKERQEAKRLQMLYGAMEAPIGVDFNQKGEAQATPITLTQPPRDNRSQLLGRSHQECARQPTARDRPQRPGR